MKGYVRLPKDLFSLSLDSKEVKVYAVLRALSFAGKRSCVKISISALSRHTGLSEEGVKRAVASLDSKGVVLRSKTYYDGRRRSNRYRVMWQGDMSRGYVALDLSLVRRFRGDKFLVYLALCSHANRYGAAYVSERALAAETGLSRNTVRRYTAELETECALEKYARFYKKHKETRARRCFAYIINDVSDIITVLAAEASKAVKRAREYVYRYIPTDLFISVFALRIERTVPPFVPP